MGSLGLGFRISRVPGGLLSVVEALGFRAMVGFPAPQPDLNRMMSGICETIIGALIIIIIRSPQNCIGNHLAMQSMRQIEACTTKPHALLQRSSPQHILARVVRLVNPEP